MPIGPVELLIILFIVLLLFGAKKVPEMSRSLGSSMREFKDGITSFGGDDDELQRREGEPKRLELERGEVEPTRADETLPRSERATPRSERTT
jgi:sec-independent protein translocase protein TatA